MTFVQASSIYETADRVQAALRMMGLTLLYAATAWFTNYTVSDLVRVSYQFKHTDVVTIGLIVFLVCSGAWWLVLRTALITWMKPKRDDAENFVFAAAFLASYSVAFLVLVGAYATMAATGNVMLAIVAACATTAFMLLYVIVEATTQVWQGKRPTILGMRM